MGAGTQMTPASLKMRVNRKVIETRCEICRAGYSLGDEVYPCELCHAYHHAHCLESGQTCPKGIVIPPDPVSFAIKSSALAEPELSGSCPPIRILAGVTRAICLLPGPALRRGIAMQN